MRTVVASMAVGVALLVPSAAQGADDAALDALRRTLDVELVNPEVNGSAGVYVWDTARQEALLRVITRRLRRGRWRRTRSCSPAPRCSGPMGPAHG